MRASAIWHKPRIFHRITQIAAPAVAMMLLSAAGLHITGGKTADIAKVSSPCIVGPHALTARDYYTIDIKPVPGVPGMYGVSGSGTVEYVDTPFGLSISKNGRYILRLAVSVQGLEPAVNGRYVVWAMPQDLDPIQRIGVLGNDWKASGIVDFRKFLVIVTREQSTNPEAQRWGGPIILRGMSRSGYMHTMAGHGLFGQDPCLVRW